MRHCHRTQSAGKVLQQFPPVLSSRTKSLAVALCITDQQNRKGREFIGRRCRMSYIQIDYTPHSVSNSSTRKNPAGLFYCDWLEICCLHRIPLSSCDYAKRMGSTDLLNRSLQTRKFRVSRPRSLGIIVKARRTHDRAQPPSSEFLCPCGL